jgi:hypothetical protein
MQIIGHLMEFLRDSVVQGDSLAVFDDSGAKGPTKDGKKAGPSSSKKIGPTSDVKGAEAANASNKKG